MTSEIPVKNLFYLYLYAWDKYNEGRSFEYNSEKISNLPNLASKVLINSAKRIIKKGLYKVYSTNNNELSFENHFEVLEYIQNLNSDINSYNLDIKNSIYATLIKFKHYFK